MVARMLLVFPLLAALSAAPAPRLAVVDLEAPDSLMALAGQVTRAVVAEAQLQKLPLFTPEELRLKLQPKQYAELKRCGSKTACVAQALEGQGIGRAVVGRFDRDEKNYLLKLWLIDVKSMTVVADVDRAILIAARRFQKDLDEAIPRLLRGEREARGTLVIEANLADARVSLNGEFVGTSPVTQSLRPGKYEVRLERRKYLSITRLLNVEADKETRERFSLLLIPGEVPDGQVPALTKKDAAAAAGGAATGMRVTAPTWVAGAVTVAAGGAGLYFALTARAQEQQLVAGYDATTQVYAGTRREALAAQQSALFANVSFGVAGAALAATIVFLVLDATAPVQVSATATGGGGGVVVGGRF
jgi:hypothetical protein